MKNFKYILTYNDLSTDEVLTKNPIGWDQLGLTYARNEKYRSVLRSFTLSLRFVKKPGGGGSNIEAAYLTKGISTSVDIDIQEHNTQTGDYDSLYVGILDFNPSRFEIARDWVEAGIIDNDKLQKFKSRDEINFDINQVISADEVSITPFVNAPRDIIFKPIDIILKVSVEAISKVPNELLQNAGDKTQAFLFSGESQLINTDTPINDIGKRLKTTDGNVQFVAPPLGINGYYPVDTTETFYNNDTDSDSQLVFSNVSTYNQLSQVAMQGVLGNNYILINARASISVFDKDDLEIFFQVLDIIVIEETNLPSGTTITPISFNLSALSSLVLNVPSEGYATFESRIEIISETNASARSTLNYYADFDFVEKSLSIGQTPAKSYLPFEAFTRLFQLATSETDTSKLFDSEFFGWPYSEFTTYPTSGNGAGYAITTAWNLREFPNRAFNLNIADLFQTFDSIFALGLGYDRINDRFFIEEVANFYKSDYLMFDLGEVSELKIKPHAESFNSKIDSGYSEKGDYEDFQGVNEYNLQSEHSTALPVKKTKPGQSKYNADSIGMELTRRQQYKTSSSKDTKQDDKIYIVRSNGSTVYVNGSTVEGFEGIEQYYNKNITPRENIIRHGGLIKSALWLHDIRVKFVKAQKDVDITYNNQNGERVNEFDDLVAIDLSKPALYVPQEYEFQSKISHEIVQILNTDPHGFIRFTFDGVDYEGFLLNVESGYYDRKANYKLLAKELTVGDNFIYEDGDNFVFETGDNFIFET